MRQSYFSSQRWLSKALTVIRDDLFWGLGMGTLAVALATYVAEGAWRSAVLALDVNVINTTRLVASPAVSAMSVGLTTLADWRVLVLAVVILGVRWLKQSQARERLLILATTGVGALLLGNWLDMLYRRPAPDTLLDVQPIQGTSLASGHLLAAVCVYGIAAYLIARRQAPSRRRWLLLATGLALALIGLGDIYLGGHYPSDIVAGLVGGGVWLAANALAYQHVQRLRVLR